MDGNTALHVASQAGHADVVKRQEATHQQALTMAMTAGSYAPVSTSISRDRMADLRCTSLLERGMQQLSHICLLIEPG